MHRVPRKTTAARRAVGVIVMALAAVLTVLGIDYPTSGSNSLSAGGGGTCHYEYSVHSGSPVVTSARCTISTKDLDQGSEPSTTVRAYVRQLGGHDGCDNDDAGHILANRLGGLAVPTNVFPQAPHLNRGAWEEFERGIAACFSSNGTKSATLSWTFDYASKTHQRPASATYSAQFDSGCDSVSQDFENACTPTGTAAAAAGRSGSGGGRGLAAAAPPVAPASLNVSCSSDGGGASAAGASGCVVVYSQADGAFALAADRLRVAVGKRAEVVHLYQPAPDRAFSSTTWCISNRSHYTSSGNLVLLLGATAAEGSDLDCDSKYVDLDAGDCTTLSLSRTAAEKLRLCFNGKA